MDGPLHGRDTHGSQAPDHLRGRVLSLYLLAFGGVAPLGGLVAGWLAEIGGLTLAFAVAGGTGLAGAMLLLASRLRGGAVGAALPPPNISSITD